jgi:Na+/H+-dicarboxylate symporter/ABC-type amino acid transport substrate-binding protein
VNLSVKILICLFSGIVVGLFFGELCSFFSYFGDGFIGLLQMTVLPYIMVSIIANLGRMSLSDGKVLVIKGLKVLAILLGIGLVTLVILPLSLPSRTAASFFSPSIVAVEAPLNLLDLYIPSNPFASMANNIVPAVVLFSIFLGIGLANIKGKEVLLVNLDILGEGLNQINKMMIKLTPYGVFAIAAYNAGTMSVDEIQRLHAYIIIYSVAVLLLGFYWLPLLISTFTGIKPKTVFRETRSTLLTIFATAKIIVVLPQLIADIKRIMKTGKEEDKEMDAKTEILTPLAYPFPNLGTIVIFVFVPFVAWFMGRDFDLPENFTFLGATFLSSFVAPIIGIPFLLDLMKLPQEMFQLFVISSVYTDRIRVVLGAIHLIALTIISVRWSMGPLLINWMKLLRGIIVGVVLTAVLIVGTRFYLAMTLGESHQYESFVEMEFRSNFDASVVKKIENIQKLSASEDGVDRLNSILKRKVLRVGYLTDRLPFAFRNSDGNLIGFDVEMVHQLASELGVQAEFYKVQKPNIAELLATQKIDMVVGGIIVTTDVLDDYAISKSYIDQTLAFVVPDYNRNKFNTQEAFLANKDLTIGSADPYFTAKLKLNLPELNVVSLSSPREFFRDSSQTVDALLLSAEAGAAWTVVYPSFSVAIPQPNIIKAPCAYPIPQHNESWKLYIDTWVELKQKDGTIDKLFKHWIEGGGAEIKEPRWSIIKDVLHWV